MKFAGRRGPRSFRRYSARPSGLRGAPSSAASGVALGAAALCLVLWLFVALFRTSLGAPATAPFLSTFTTPLFLAARYAAADDQTGWWLVAGVLLLGLVWLFPARWLRRRPLDALFVALLTLETFHLARWANSFLPKAELPHWVMLSQVQKLSLALGVFLSLSLLAAWMLRPQLSSPYNMSAPSHVTGFLKKRRRRALLIGGVLMILAIGAILAAAYVAFGGRVMGINDWGEYEIQLAPVVALAIFIVADLVYLLGRKYWYRLT